MDFSYSSKDEIKKALSQLLPENIKGGIARDNVDAKYRSIFDALDKKNTNGILEDNEIQDLQTAAGKDGIFSLGEIKKLIKILGLKDSTNAETFVSFLSDIIGLSAKIEKVETVPADSGNNTVITYKEDESKQQKVEVRDSSGKLVKTVIYKNVGTENVTYEVYVKGKLTEGKDEKGEYFCNERAGYGIMNQMVAYEKVRNTPNGQTKEYYTKEGICIGGDDEKGFYRRTELGDGRYKIGRGDCELDYYELYDANNKIIGGKTSDGIYTREYLNRNDEYVNMYTQDNRTIKAFFTDNELVKTEVTETKDDVTYKKSVTSTGIEVEISGEPNSKIYIDFEKITKPFEGEEKEQLIEALKQMPSQVLLDLFIEATFTKDKIGDGTDGSFWSVTDKITLSGGSFSVDTIVHELGHALDCLGKGDNSRFQSDGKKFSGIFHNEMKQYLAQGNKRCTSGYDKEGKYYTNNNDDGENYATIDENEMFAECYTLIMLGYCDSENVINTYFKKTLACANEIIASTRKRSASVRHPKQ